jgi:small-conductance mechanosensitive channel
MEFLENLIVEVPILNTGMMINLVKSLFLLGIFLIINFLIKKFLINKVEDVRSRYHWRKFSNYAIALIVVLAIGRLWFEGIQTLATFFGLLSAGIAVALKDVIASFAGWVFIISRRPFAVGDRIQIGDKSGDVIDLRLFEFTILEIGNWVGGDQSTGRIVHIPNGKIFTQDLVNYETGFKYIWNEIGVTITFESNWKKAKQIMFDIASTRPDHITSSVESQIKRTAKKYMIYYNKLTPIVYTDVRDNGVRLTLRYLCDVRKRRSSAEDIWENILLRFAEHSDIDLAYPTQRFYDNLAEGKPGTKPAYYTQNVNASDHDRQGTDKP